MTVLSQPERDALFGFQFDSRKTTLETGRSRSVLDALKRKGLLWHERDELLGVRLWGLTPTGLDQLERLAS